MNIRLLTITSLLFFTFAGSVQAKQEEIKQLGIEAIKAAFTELKFSQVKAADMGAASV